MPEPTVPNLGVTLHVDADLSVRVNAIRLKPNGPPEPVEPHRPVTMLFGTVDVGVHLIGTLAEVHRLVIEADRQLAQLAEDGGR